MRNLNVQVSGKIGRESVRKSNIQISRQTQVVFGQKIKCLGFFEQARAIFGQKFEYADFGAKIGDFLGEISTKSGIWMKCSHRSHDGFFRTDFRTFRAFSQDFRTTCFFKVSIQFRTSFRAFFARFSHDLFFKVFCSHVSRVFARSSFAGRRPACLCQIRSKSAQTLRKSLVSIGAPQNF